MKKAVLALVAVVSFVVMIMAFSSGGHIMLFGVPVSALFFVVVLKIAAKELEK